MGLGHWARWAGRIRTVRVVLPAALVLSSSLRRGRNTSCPCATRTAMTSSARVRDRAVGARGRDELRRRCARVVAAARSAQGGARMWAHLVIQCVYSPTSTSSSFATADATESRARACASAIGLAGGRGNGSARGPWHSPCSSRVAKKCCDAHVSRSTCRVAVLVRRAALAQRAEARGQLVAASARYS